MSELEIRIYGPVPNGQTPRDHTAHDWNILRHYEAEISKSRMTLNQAADRAKHDLASASGHEAKDQRRFQ